MATKKTTKTDGKELTGPQVVENNVENDAGKSPAQIEVENEGKSEGEKKYPTFTVMIAGEEMELEDRWESQQRPGALMFLGSDEFASRYAPAVIEQIIGEDQTFKILMAGAGDKDMGEILQAWSKSRGVSGK